MADNNAVDSMLNVTTLTGLILNEFLNRLEEWSPQLAYVYDEALTYETAVEKHRTDKNISDNADSVLPLFAFKRSVLVPDTENSTGRRIGNSKIKCTLPDGTIETYKGMAGTFNIEFLYISRNMQDIERFEISYLLERSVSDIKNLDVFIPKLDTTIPYSLRYNDLDEKIINTDNNYYKALSGVFSLHGIFLSFENVGKRIEQINQSVREPVTGTTPETSQSLCNITIEPKVD